MRVALMHYHLRPGGVTSVIREQAAALSGTAECLVLSGEPVAPGTCPAAAVRAVPGIGYARPGETSRDPGETASAILAAMREHWGGPADVLHVHNPTLNRNPSLPAVLRRLQESGIRLLLQCHDFAEDGRPWAYYSEEDYPKDCHYAVLTSRDRGALLSAGLNPSGTHLAWNVIPALPFADSTPPRRPGARTLVYPVRAIRRKNVGEAMLLGTLLGARLVVTLPPRNEPDLARLGRWKAFAREHELPVRFDAGLAKPLVETMAEADAAVTTSVNEGFGFAFLEPWTAGVPVVGRRLEHVCSDFEAEGIRIPALYHVFPVPLECIDAGAFRARWQQAITGAWRAFGRELGDALLRRTWSGMTTAGSVDFGCLDEPAQQEAIARLMSDRRMRERLDGPALEATRTALAGRDTALAESNKAAIMARYSRERYRELLARVYHAVREQPVSHGIDKPALLDSFLKPERFRMTALREKT